MICIRLGVSILLYGDGGYLKKGEPESSLFSSLHHNLLRRLLRELRRLIVGFDSVILKIPQIQFPEGRAVQETVFVHNYLVFDDLT